MIASLAKAAEQVSSFIDTCRAEPHRPTHGLWSDLACALFRLQVAHNSVYQRFCRARGVLEVDHWGAIPALPATAFKSLEVTSIPAGARISVFHSSGTTTHEPGRHFHHETSLALYEKSLRAWFEPHFPQFQQARLVSLSPPASQAPHSSLAHMFEVIRKAAGNGIFLGRVEGQGVWTLDLPQTVDKLREEAASGRPVLLLGTAFLYVALLDALRTDRARVTLPAGSWLFETGGYKGRTRELPKADLYTGLAECFGIAPEAIVSEYGMSELSSQAYDGVAGQNAARIFRFPPWARAQVISPETGREVGEGECGLIRILDLANVYSVMAIQTEDLGVRRGEGVELVGRASGAEARGCSLLTI